LGTDSFIAQVVAQLICEESQALLLPPIPYTYAGVASPMEGTISVDLAATTAYLEAVFAAMLRAKLGPLVVVSAHGGNDVTCVAALERLFHHQPAGLLYCNVLGREYMDLMAEVWGVACPTLAENCCLWAAWEMQEHPERLRPRPPSDQEGKPEPLHRIAKAGYVVHAYHLPSHHIPIRGDGTAAQGRLYLERAARRIVSVLDDLQAYHNELTAC